MFDAHQKTLARIDIIMRWARPHDLPYGGCHVLLAGNFFQLPPTKGLPLYVDIGQYASPTEQEICGYELWRRHDKVVVLTENKRQEGDLDWGQGCRQARKGIWTPVFVDLINTRYISNKEICEQFSHSQPLMLSKYHELIGELQGHSYAPFITPSNKAPKPSSILSPKRAQKPYLLITFLSALLLACTRPREIARQPPYFPVPTCLI
jgi:hypothetical protein